jgi:hypothetical protein
MKELYFVKIQNTSTKQVKVRQLLLTKEVFEGFQLKLGKTESGYTLLEIWQQ